MYGLINSALRSMIIERFGEEKWLSVMESAGVPSDSFMTMRSYDDQITYQLAGAVSEVLGAPVETCLELFGEYWITVVATNSYGSILDIMGDNVEEFIASIDSLHDRISTTFINYVPPSFSVTHLDDNQLKVLYTSQRAGLTPFVLGLFKGIGLRFDKTLSVVSSNTNVNEQGESTEFVLSVA